MQMVCPTLHMENVRYCSTIVEWIHLTHAFCMKSDQLFPSSTEVVNLPVQASSSSPFPNQSWDPWMVQVWNCSLNTVSLSALWARLW